MPVDEGAANATPGIVNAPAKVKTTTAANMFILLSGQSAETKRIGGFPRVNIIRPGHGPHIVIAGALGLLLAVGHPAWAQGRYVPAEPLPPPKPGGPAVTAPKMPRDVAQRVLTEAGFTGLSNLTPWFDGWQAVAERGGRSMIVTIESSGAIIAPSPQWFPPLQSR